MNILRVAAAMFAATSPADVSCAITACQQRHATEHAAAAAVLGRLGLPISKPARRKRPAA